MERVLVVLSRTEGKGEKLQGICVFSRVVCASVSKLQACESDRSYGALDWRSTVLVHGLSLDVSSPLYHFRVHCHWWVLPFCTAVFLFQKCYFIFLGGKKDHFCVAIKTTRRTGIRFLVRPWLFLIWSLDLEFTMVGRCNYCWRTVRPGAC